MQITTQQDATILRSAVDELIAEGLVNDQNNMQALTTALETSPSQLTAENVKQVGYDLKNAGKVSWKSAAQIAYDKAASRFSSSDIDQIARFIPQRGLIATGDDQLTNFVALANWLIANNRGVQDLDKALGNLINSSQGGNLRWQVRNQQPRPVQPEPVKIGPAEPEYDAPIPRGLTPANLEIWKSNHRKQPQAPQLIQVQERDWTKLADDVLLNIQSNAIREEARKIVIRGNPEATYELRRKFIDQKKFQGYR